VGFEHGGYVRISLDTLPAGHASWSFTAQDAWAKQAANFALDSELTSFEGTLDVRVSDDGVLVTGQVRAQAPGICERCGVELTRMIDVPVSLRYVAEPKIEDEELELEVEDLDVGYHDGSLDLASVLSEAIALAAPARTECEDASSCDERTQTLLNTHGRAGDEHASPFSSLKGLTLN